MHKVSIVVITDCPLTPLIRFLLNIPWVKPVSTADTFGGCGFTENGLMGDPMDLFFFSVTTGGGVRMAGF